MKYVLMFVETEQYAADLAAMGEGERERAYARVRQWFADHHDKIADLDEALRLSRSWPACPVVEIRPIAS